MKHIESQGKARKHFAWQQSSKGVSNVEFIKTDFSFRVCVYITCMEEFPQLRGVDAALVLLSCTVSLILAF